MARAHVTELRVRYSETDQMQVVHHANYLAWCEIGRTDYMRALGRPYAEVEREGVALAVVEAHLSYRAPARYDDAIRVTTTVAEVRSRVVRFEYVIENAETGQRLVNAATTLVGMDRNGCAVALPADLRAALEREVAA